MRIKSSAIAIIVLVVIFGSVAYTSYSGDWTTKNDRVPAKYSAGQASGQYDPADIRGSYTFADIESNFGVPADELAAAFGIQGRSAGAVQVKELEGMFTTLAEQGKHVGTDSVRTFVALYKGLPTTLNESTYLPTPAVEILKTKATLSEEQLQYLDKHTVDIP